MTDPAATRGLLRVYLGAAPGVGKTLAMLEEGHRRAQRGTDVVVAFVESHGRPRTAAAVTGLEVVPRREVDHRGTSLAELDTAAVLRRAPAVALVDELAHSNAPGSPRDKRWQDVELLLEAGIDVITTVNVQHLESLNDIVRSVTGVVQRETVPDAVVRAAEQVQLVDMTPEALRRRMAHGNIYGPAKVDAALANFFRVGNLTALRELALLWLADSVDQGLQRYRRQHGIEAAWETRERVVVALTGGPEGETLIRRAARIAARASGGELLAVHVARSDGLTGASVAVLQQQRLLVESLGGSYHSVAGEVVADALLAFARSVSASQVVVGVSRRPAWQRVFGGGTAATVIRQSGSVDVHVVTHDYAGAGRVLPRSGHGVAARRRVASLLLAAVLVVVISAALSALQGHVSLAGDVQVYLVAVVVVALVGGLPSALVMAVASALALNYYFTRPRHSLDIARADDVLALGVFLVIAVLVALVVEAAARRSSQAARSSAEAEALATLAGSVLRGDAALPALLHRVQETFGFESVTLLERGSGAPASGPGDLVAGGRRGHFLAVAGVGRAPGAAGSGADDVQTEVPVGDALVLVARGKVLAADDQRILAAFAATVGSAYRQAELARQVENTASLADADRVRSALLAAVSHDLRTPLAGAKAAITSLRATDVTLAPEAQAELLAGADEDIDRVTKLVGDLLDLSRLEAGVLSVFPAEVAADEVVAAALDAVAGAASARIELPPDLPLLVADPVLLERVLANLVQNALRHSPAEPPLLAASAHGRRVEIRVVDRGPGIAPEQWTASFTPFQRLGDATNHDGPGVGLGLALARGFVTAMDGSLDPEQTPGGGLTMVVTLPAAPGQEEPGAPAGVGR